MTTKIRYNLITGGYLEQEWPDDASDAAEHLHLIIESGNEPFEVRREGRLILIPLHSVLTVEVRDGAPPEGD